MESVLSGAADLTEPYWTVSGFYKGRARSEHLELGCTVLGTESIFFTRAPISPPPPPIPSLPPALEVVNLATGDDTIADWLIALIAVGAVTLLALCALVGLMAAREKAGRPMFTTLDASVDAAGAKSQTAVTVGGKA
jgi:hypothetical protein